MWEGEFKSWITKKSAEKITIDHEKITKNIKWLNDSN